MRLARSCLALLLAAVCSSSDALALAQPAPSSLFSAYQDLCLRHRGDPALTFAAAKAAGWSEPPPSDLLPLGALSMNDGRQLERSTAAGRWRLAVGHAMDPAQIGAGAASWRVCVVSGEPADASAAAALQHWAGVAPTSASDAADGSLLFVMSGPAGSRRSADGLTSAQMQERIRAKDLVAAGVKTVGSVTLLIYATPQP